MATDDERREVAKRLRELPSDTHAALKEWEDDGLFIDASLSDEADYSQIHNAVFGCFPAEHMHPGDYEELHERLADLIDRPTCQNKQVVYNRTAPKEFRTDNFTCSACGETFCADVDGVNHPIDWAFCPNCGAEVLND